jgi:hypothetical protein
MICVFKRFYGVSVIQTRDQFRSRSQSTRHPHRQATAPSATKMTKNLSTKFGAEIMVTVNGKIQYASNGKPQKAVIQMGSHSHSNFYDSDGLFIGMTRILEECGLVAESKLKASCKGFNCEKGATDCCQRRVLYNQPDFTEGESALEIACKA